MYFLEYQYRAGNSFYVTVLLMKTPCSHALTAKYEKSWLVALTKELPLSRYIQIAAVDFPAHKHLLSDLFFHSCNSTQGIQLSSGCLLAVRCILKEKCKSRYAKCGARKCFYQDSKLCSFILLSCLKKKATHEMVSLNL